MRRLAGVDECGVLSLKVGRELVYMWSGPAIDVAVNFESTHMLKDAFCLEFCLRLHHAPR